ncbi:glycoside hydrolase family 6 protein [Streptomyces sp. BI20]|uniref:glycoside hydrolase family 6 protein n=1 Tax=Streptomyces sp. BI20 TaxID=3403460 RepID=UPI003C74B05E
MSGRTLPPGRARRGRPAGLALTLLLLPALLVSGCADPGPERPGRDPGGAGSAAPSRAGASPAGAPDSPYWVDDRSDAARQVAEWRAAGRNGDAEVLRRISERPMALWAPGDDPGPELRRASAAAAAAGRTLVAVAYNIPYRDCGQHSAGGSADAAAYQRWIGAFADNLGTAPAVVVLEPDAVPHVVDGCTQGEHHEERYALLSEAVDRLKARPRTKVYLDAGNPAWIPDPTKLVEPLRRAGVERADGFSLNVSNFQPDEAGRAYGGRLSKALGGKHFVLDTSRNGDGPLPGSRDQAWCNPPGRALGKAPTDRTGDPLVDAYLWVKRPGESDGECRGGPAAGRWWPEYALGLARRARG